MRFPPLRPTAHLFAQPRPQPPGKSRARSIRLIVPAEVGVARALLRMTGMDLADLPPPHWGRSANAPAANGDQPPDDLPPWRQWVTKARGRLQRSARLVLGAVRSLLTPRI